ncbi:hypothetical protein J3R30DRAFT_3706696 [Lentinula aciculospora]|uniref:Uncharacterized protein n=1 Tax=Lentinula aciculospora TaxID=153920 RepID=A0A9W9DKL1_9AGAR|nr:hypothetical protein J3R30DRAFT_3706696 [Lentinula aciculospora]
MAILEEGGRRVRAQDGSTSIEGGEMIIVTFTATQKGIAQPDVNGPNPLLLPDILYVPELANTLISIGCLDDAGYSVSFGSGGGVIWDQNRKSGDLGRDRQILVPTTKLY